MKSLDSNYSFFVFRQSVPLTSLFRPLVFREALYRGPFVREKERPGVEVVLCDGYLIKTFKQTLLVASKGFLLIIPIIIIMMGIIMKMIIYHLHKFGTVQINNLYFSLFSFSEVKWWPFVRSTNYSVKSFYGKRVETKAIKGIWVSFEWWLNLQSASLDRSVVFEKWTALEDSSNRNNPLV